METCRMPTSAYQDLGIALGGIVSVHEIGQHQGTRCESIRLEISSFVFHCLELGPSQMEDMKKRLMDHLNDCHCGNNRELRR